MPQCLSVRCGRWANDEWVCCAHCGDPLPGKRAHDESTCDHDFALEGRYCILCGFDPEVGSRAERRDLLLVGALICLGGLLVTGLGAVFLAGGPPTDPAAGGSRGGPRTASYMVVVGLVVFAFGLGKVFKALRLGD